MNRFSALSNLTSKSQPKRRERSISRRVKDPRRVGRRQGASKFPLAHQFMQEDVVT
jgi:hypothetical protein